MSSLPIVLVVGPTAVGKSDLSLLLAHELAGEIVNADSMQLYRGLDIGTAKLALEQRQGIPHHLLDIWELRHQATVSQYQQLARDAIADIQSRGRVPILVGGSGLYVNAVVDDLKFPGTDQQVRGRLEAELDEVGPHEMHRRLAELDPAAGFAIYPGNGRRIVRALEVMELTGQPFTATLARGIPKIASIGVGLRVDRVELDRRIEARVEMMWQLGLVDEVAQLVGEGLLEAPTAARALGYQQILSWMSGSGTQEQAKLDTIVGTRRLARKQLGWFNRDERLAWFDVDDLPQARGQVLKFVSSALN